MVKIDEHKREIERVKSLIPTAKGKRLYDLQTYLKRLKREMAEAEWNIRQAERGTI